MKARYRLLLTTCAWGVASIATAQPSVAGRLEFAYRQFPSGSYAGTFVADGNLVDVTSFPPAAPGAVHAVHVLHDGVYTILVLGGFGNADDSGDIAFVLLQSEQPFAPGTYYVDPVTFSVTYGFLDDASGLEIPAEPWAVDWRVVLESIVADHKLAAISGIVTLTTVEPTHIAGTFGGYMAELDGPLRVAVSDASFSVGVTVLPVEATSWGEIKAFYRD